MTDAGIDQLSRYPVDRGCTAPTTARILEIFTGVPRHQLTATDGHAAGGAGEVVALREVESGSSHVPVGSSTVMPPQQR